MKITWATDLHLDKLANLPGNPAKALGEYLRKDHPESEALLVTGDISIARSLRQHLAYLQEGFGAPVYYVLGNHDYYGKSWEQVAKSLRNWDQPNQVFLDQASPLLLTEDIWLVGRSGWFDARLCRSVEMAVGETRCIMDAKFDPSTLVLEKMRHYADRQADHARRDLKEAYQKGARKVLFLTHYPPYQEATWHEGKQSEGAWLGIMTSITMGLTLDRFKAEAPDCQITVLCGHTHSPGECHRSNGIRVLTGKSVYNYPDAVPGFGCHDPQEFFREGRLAPDSWPLSTSEATC